VSLATEPAQGRLMFMDAIDEFLVHVVGIGDSVGPIR
jgi:hypothetical protein